MKRCFALLVWAGGLTLGSLPFAQAAVRPKIENLRYQEDWRPLADPALRTQPLDRVKYIPLPVEGMYLSLGGEARARYEVFNHPGFGAEPEDHNGYWLQRYLLHADLHAGSRARLFIQFQSSWEDGRLAGPRFFDEDKMTFQQLFLDYRVVGTEAAFATVRFGRQELELGPSKLVSTRDILNTRLTFDGGRLLVHHGKWTYTGFYLEPMITKPGFFDNPVGSHQAFWGTAGFNEKYLTSVGTLGAHFYGFDAGRTLYNQGRAEEYRYSGGGRLFNLNKNNWDYDIALLYQFGRFGSGPIQAWGVVTDSGYRFNGPGKVRAGVRFDATSGDTNPNDNKLGTFSPLFTAAAYSGLAGLLGPSNLMDVTPSVSFMPLKKVTFTGGSAFFWRTSLDDGIYGISTNLLRSSARSRARRVGTQSTAQLRIDVTTYLSLMTTYTHFFAGPFLHESPPGQDVDFVSSAVTFKF